MALEEIKTLLYGLGIDELEEIEIWIFLRKEELEKMEIKE